MEHQLISQLSWGFCSNEEGMEELKHTLLLTTLELETTLISAKEEITKREVELNHLKDVLSKTMKERDEAQSKCHKLMLEKFTLEQRLQQNKQETGSISGVSSSDDESNSNTSLVSCRGLESMPQVSSSCLPLEALKLAANRPLPVKGKLLQAVKDAGPLLKNLLLAGPLPQWQHPPPQLATIEIPPVAICSPKKRDLENYEGFESSPNTKYHKVALHSTIPDMSILTRT